MIPVGPLIIASEKEEQHAPALEAQPPSAFQQPSHREYGFVQAVKATLQQEAHNPEIPTVRMYVI